METNEGPPVLIVSTAEAERLNDASSPSSTPTDDTDETTAATAGGVPGRREKEGRGRQRPSVYESFGALTSGGSVDPVAAASVPTGASSSSSRRQRTAPRGCDNGAIERANLVSICKLVVKQLIDASIAQGCVVEEDLDPLKHFFVVMEHILFHGIKQRKGLLWDRTDCWSILEGLAKFDEDACNIVKSVRDMNHIKSSLGRVRAWLRLAMMQKKLPDYFRLLIDLKEQLQLYSYETGALLLADEAGIIAGLLVGLNVIDCNVAIKDDDLDRPMDVIDFSLYLKEIISSGAVVRDDENVSFHKVAAILNQKHYLEECNRQLTATVANLNQKMEEFQIANALMTNEVENAKSGLIELQQENSMLLCENSALHEGHQQQLMTVQQDVQIERETYQQSRQGLDSLYQEAKMNLNEEIQTRLDLEKELFLQIGMKQETDIAMRLLEKDSLEKQDLIVSLRTQVDEVKSINLETLHKLQTVEGSIQNKADVVNQLELKTGQMVSTIRDMEDEMRNCEAEQRSAAETARKLGSQMADKEAKRQMLETDLRIEREWRATLQKNLEQEKAKTSQRQKDLQHLVEVKKEYESLQSKHLQLRLVCEDQEKALAELGSHLSQSKLKMEDLKEAQQAMREAQWTDDREANACRQCAKLFSVSIRKHHCRNCGEIFCNECSNAKMPLPSSAKPVRVCDDCNSKLLQCYSPN